MSDIISHPAHYTAGKVECIDALEAATAGLEGIEAVCTANAIKYLWRWKRKNGAQDLRKARWYIDRLLGEPAPDTHDSRDLKRAALADQLKPGEVCAVDFDGTLCENAYPEIGAPYEKYIEALKAARWSGVKLILYTCREGERLDRAVYWCAERGLTFDAVNENLPERIAQYGGDCKKISADYYHDDRAVGL